MPTTPVARANTFAELNIQPGLHQALSTRAIVSPSPIQAEVIPLLLDGHDVIGQARTGSGKTLAFALPVVERCDPARRGVQALILVPTRELAIQVGEVIGHLAGVARLKHTLLYGGRSLLPEQRALRSAQIVVGTPGRTLDHLRQGGLSLGNIRILVLDEADEMLDRGFAPDVERIIGFAATERQTALFSATVPDWVGSAARKFLRKPVTVAVDPDESSPPDIEHLIFDVDATAKMGALTTLLDRRGDGPVIVFGRTKHGVKNLAQKLVKMGYPSAALQGNLSQNARERVMADFRAGRVPILLATNVAARGLDVQDVECVINYELPESAEWFTHRVGRTGRMGRRGQAITLLTAADAVTWRQFERQLGRTFRREAWAAGPATAAAATTTTTSAASGSTATMSAMANRGAARPRPLPPANPQASRRASRDAAGGPRAPQRPSHAATGEAHTSRQASRGETTPAQASREPSRGAASAGGASRQPSRGAADAGGASRQPPRGAADAGGGSRQPSRDLSRRRRARKPWFRTNRGVAAA